LRRAAALATLLDPSSTLLMEWSTPAGTPIEDRDAWRDASPHWTKQRARLLDAKLARVSAGVSEDPDEDDPVESFRSQYLNVWPVRRLVTGSREEPLVEPAAWEAAKDLTASIPPGPVIAAVEDWYGRGAAAVCSAVLPDGRLLTWGDLFATRETAIAWAAYSTEGRPGSGIVAGASIPLDSIREAAPEVPVEKVTTGDLRTGLPLLRALLRQGRLSHDGSDAMGEQVIGARVQERETGLVLPHRAARMDLVRALAWSVQATVNGGPAPMPRPAVY
jgi:hypothetical protein